MTNPLQHQIHRNQRVFKLKHQLMALAISLGLGLGVTQVSFAKNVNPPSLRANAPHVYVVKKGDTLWDISGRFLKSPWRWKEIWASNRHVKNPHWIYPGDRLLLCSLNGKPLIGKDEGDGCDGIIRRAGGTTVSAQVRVEALNDMIPVIPLESIRPWLEHRVILAPDSLANIPYIVGTTADHLISSEGDRVYARGNGLIAGQRYDIYRQGEPYTTTDSNGKAQVIGVELIKVASAQASQTGQTNNITTLQITKSFTQEVRKSDLVLPVYNTDLPTLFYPVPAKEVREGGKVIRIMDSLHGAAKYSVIAIDRGANDHVQAGYIFALDLQGETTIDPKTKEKIQLPNQRAGHAMVFKIFDNISYAIVLDSSLPIKMNAKLAIPLSEE